MTFLIRFCITLLSFFSFVVPASAQQNFDPIVLSTHESWEVVYMAQHGSGIEPYCFVRTVNPAGFELSVSSGSWDTAGSMAAHFPGISNVYSEAGLERVPYEWRLQIDRRPFWTFEAVLFTSESLVVWRSADEADPNIQRFFTQFVSGNQIHMLNDNYQPITSWSLTGSLAAITAWVECVDRL